MPSSFSSICVEVHASSSARCAARKSRYRSASSNARSREPATSVVNATLTERPAGTVIVVRSANIGSSTAPVVSDSGPISSSAAGCRTVRPRPRKRARSVSYETVPACSSFAITCTHHTGTSEGSRGRRVPVNALHHECHSVSTKRFENAGCALSASGGARTISP